MARTAITGSLIAIELDENSQESIHQQIEGKLRAAIVSGRLPADTRLPSTRIFASEIGVSRNTVLQVFEALTEEGLLISRLGAGTFVAELTDGSTGLFGMAVIHSDPSRAGARAL